jgi:hypothetical protein
MGIADKSHEILSLFNLEQTILISGTDKGLTHSYIDNVYGPIFDIISPQSILEIGIKSGASLVLWHKLFPNSVIVGVDNDLTNFNNQEAIKLLHAGKIDVVENDAYGQLFVEELNHFDFIIDDGPHTHDSQIKALNFTQKLSQTGTMVIEDIYPRYNELSNLLSKSRKIPNAYSTFINMLPYKGRNDDLVFVITFNDSVKDYLKLCEKTWPNRFTSNRFLFALTKMVSRGKFYKNLFANEFNYFVANKKAFFVRFLTPYRWG